MPIVSLDGTSFSSLPRVFLTGRHTRTAVSITSRFCVAETKTFTVFRQHIILINIPGNERNISNSLLVGPVTPFLHVIIIQQYREQEQLQTFSRV